MKQQQQPAVSTVTQCAWGKAVGDIAFARHYINCLTLFMHNMAHHSSTLLAGLPERLVIQSDDLHALLLREPCDTKLYCSHADSTCCQQLGGIWVRQKEGWNAQRGS